ncbi:MAG: rRNA maturation RNase YbeY [Clostridia bacterium]|nr:rRNA maturation RNase YbeY [Clostridia bacterium]
MEKTLKILGKSKIVNLDDLASATFEVLGQKEPLYAELNFVSKARIKELNSQFRSVFSVTDVLSFPTLDGVRGKVLKHKDFPLDTDENGLFIGSIAICTTRAKEQAIEYGHSIEREITYLTLHGLLHLFGYDHMDLEDKAEMRKLEDKILEKVKVFR